MGAVDRPQEIHPERREEFLLRQLLKGAEPLFPQERMPREADQDVQTPQRLRRVGHEAMRLPAVRDVRLEDHALGAQGADLLP